MAQEKLLVVVPDEDKFEPAPIPFGVVNGEGVDNYDGDGKVFTVTLVLDKKQNKHFRKIVMDFWEDEKGKNAGDEPDNWENITRKGDKKGEFLLYAKTNTEFDGKANNIAIVNHEGSKLDPEEYGSMGAGTLGRIAINLSIYEQGKGRKMRSGISMFLSAVKLTDFVKYESKGGAAAFGTEKGKVSGKGGFKKEKSKNKDKKKKSKKK